MRQLGIVPVGATIDFQFNTFDKANGALITLAGSPTLLAFRDNDTGSETATGLTLTVDHDSRTGKHNVRVVTTDSFYQGGSKITIALAAGTVDGTTVTNTILAEFTLDGSFHVGTAQAGASGSITLAAAASATDDFYNGNSVSIVGLVGAGQAPRYGYDYNGTSKVLSITPNWATNPDNTSRYIVGPLGAAMISRFAEKNFPILGIGTAGDKFRVT